MTDLKCGEIISAKILSFSKYSVKLKIGQSILGTVAFNDLTDVPLKNPSLRFKVGQQVVARVKKKIYKRRKLFQSSEVEIEK